MTVPTKPWEATKPAGSDSFRDGDNKIRDFKEAVRERLSYEHEFEPAGIDAEGTGLHKEGSARITRSAPPAPTDVLDGRLWYDSTNKKMYIADGATFAEIDLAGMTTLFTPSGIIQMFGGAAAPSGWLICDGSAVSRTTYAALFAIIGTTFGIGNGSTTFNIPDMRGRSPIGVGQGAGLTNRVLGATIGAETHALSVFEMPPHTHSTGVKSGVLDAGGDAFYSAVDGTTGSAGGGGVHNNMQPSKGLNFIIKV